MRQILNPVEAVKVETELGPIHIIPSGLKGAHVNAPHLDVNGIPLQASLLLVSSDGSNWNLMEQWNVSTQRFSIADHAIQARLVDGRAADFVTLGKITEVVISAVRKLSQPCVK